MSRRGASAMIDSFVACMLDMNFDLSRWTRLRREFKTNVELVRVVMACQAGHEVILAKLVTVAAIIAEMHRYSVDKAGRMIAYDTLVRLNTFTLINFGMKVAHRRRLEQIATQDRIDRGIKLSRRVQIAMHAVSA